MLLLIPTTSYRTQAFLDAARTLNVELTVCSERPNVFAKRNPGGLLTLDFAKLESAASTVVNFSKEFPIVAVVGVDDQSTMVAARVAEVLSLLHNSVASVTVARNKYRTREALARTGLPVPKYALFSFSDDPAEVARSVDFPCVLKPLMLSASHGVIRADNEEEFVAAFRRLGKILGESEFARDVDSQHCLVEDFISGTEVALEGLLVKGKLNLLALFDKPDPLDGPYFEETIYVTPSRLPNPIQEDVVACTARALRALGLTEGPVHAEVRVNDDGCWIIEVAARSIGGFCSRALRFDWSTRRVNILSDAGRGVVSLEEIILRHVLGMDIESLEREAVSSGVMMIPIPSAGVLTSVRGLQEGKAVEGIGEIIMSAHPGETLVPLPEGGKYLGFIFSRAESSALVEASLREAHRRLEFTIAATREAGVDEGDFADRDTQSATTLVNHPPNL